MQQFVYLLLNGRILAVNHSTSCLGYVEDKVLPDLDFYQDAMKILQTEADASVVVKCLHCISYYGKTL